MRKIDDISQPGRLCTAMRNYLPVVSTPDTLRDQRRNVNRLDHTLCFLNPSGLVDTVGKLKSTESRSEVLGSVSRLLPVHVPPAL